MRLPISLRPLPTKSWLWGIASIGITLAMSGNCAFGEEEVQFNRDIRPILSEYCLACHGFDASTREAGLRLDSREGALEELSSGEHAIRPGESDLSELVRRIESEDEGMRMPPHESGKHLSPKQILLLRKWIDSGAPYDTHWAFRPIGSPEVPVNAKSGGANSSPIDAFVSKMLSEKGIEPSLQASLETLIRRVSLDLIGLPPTVEEITSFKRDFAERGQDAYRELVDRLLDSPHYGERWGRWWLDQARYSDSNGYSIDAPRSIWLYRDWVVKAFNEDMPFDQFAIEQLAGDLLPNPTQDQRIATGFHRNTQINQEGGIDPEQFRIESVFDRVATTGTVFLGLTIGCAQCHDHKFDPISQSEFYQLFAFFNDQDEPDIKVYPDGIDVDQLVVEKKVFDVQLVKLLDSLQIKVDEWEKETAPQLEKPIKEVTDSLRIDPAKRNAKQRSYLAKAMLGPAAEETKEINQLLAEIRRFDLELNKGVSTMVMKERETPRSTFVYTQGDFTRPAAEVTPGTPAVLPELPSSERRYNRLDLAKWIVAPENPLTARVIVNRVWQVYFGRGIVETENDFGFQSSVPTFPEMLDWLAKDWFESGLRFKSLHRRIVCSEAYMRDSRVRKDLAEIDPQNYFLARQQRLRLDAELVRDVGLAASGLLVSKQGGAPVFPPIPDGVMSQGQVKREWKVSTGEDRYRRGLYTFIYRATPPPSLNVFDAPEGNSTCTRRNRSNTPLQALTLLNDTAYFEFAQSLEKIIQSEGIEVAFQRCTSRLPTSSERALFEGLDSLSAARVLLNLDETITRE